MTQFAIIMPLHNKAPYVRRAVESVLGQTHTGWELWVVDDGSTDGSAEVVNPLTGDPRIHLHRQANAGVGAARNRGVALSGEAASCPPLLAFLDADDWWEPTFLEEMAALVARHPDAGICGTAYRLVKNGRPRPAPLGLDKDFGEGEIDYFRLYARTLCMPLTSISVCLPRTAFAEAGGFPESIRLGEDFLLWARVALRHPVVLLDKPLANYNQDADPTHRGTGHLTPPEHHFLWHLGPLEEAPQAKQLLDNMRCYNLLPYLLSAPYHHQAQGELRKVDWSRQPARIRRLYALPRPLLRLRQHLLHTGSALKQWLARNLPPAAH